MMEEEALLINISTILAKDIILDNKVKIKRPSYPHPCKFDFEDDEDGLDLLVYEMQQRGDSPFGDDKIVSISDSSNEYQKQSVMQENRFSGIRGRRQDIKFQLGDYFTISEFESNLHLRKSTFYKLVRTLSPLVELGIRDINGVIVSEESFLSLGLWKLATDEHFEEISRRFKVPLDICHWTVNNFCNLLSTNLKMFMKWPESREHQTAVLEKFSSCPGLQLPNLFGIIALQQVDIFLESQDEEAAVILQVICTPDQKLIDCHVDMAASYSFDQTPFAKNMLTEEGHMPKDTYLIGDCSLPLKKYLMRPFRTPANLKEKKFNDALAEKRDIMNAVLKKMMKRFHSLYALEARNIKEVRKVLEAICALHNLYESNKDNYVNDSKNFDGKTFSRHFTDEDDEDGKTRRMKLMNSLGL